MSFDLTFFESDERTPFFGIADTDPITNEVLDVLLEADFSTDAAHPRPYLGEVKDWSATELDLIAASSTIGSVRLAIVDKRTDPLDQDTGILTSRLSEIVGKMALLRRVEPGTGDLISAFRGLVTDYRMGGNPAGLVEITVSLRDMRERERQQSLFDSNFVIFGVNGDKGPGIDYGALPVTRLRELIATSTPHLISAVAPYKTTAPHFHLAPTIPDGIRWGWVSYTGKKTGDPFNLTSLEELNYPTQGADGLWYYTGFTIQWRAAGSGDPWTVLSDMPRETNTAAAVPKGSFVESIFSGVGAVDYWPLPRLYFGSFDGADIPADGQAIELQVLANRITDKTPFFWDGGTLGNLLREIYDGLHSPGSPPIPYNEAAMAAFEAATPAERFIITEPVTNMREWVEKNIYAAVGWVPSLDADGRVRPVSAWELPEDPEAVPLVTPEALVPVGEWSHGSENVVNTVEYTYVRESVANQETTKQKTGRKKFFLFGERKEVEVEGTLSAWERYFTRDVVRVHVDIASIATFGTKKITLEPTTVRSLGDADGRPRQGSTTDEAGTQLADSISKHVLDRFKNGAPQYSGDVLAADPGVSGLVIGGYVRAQPTWMPQYSTGKRGARRFMQITAISDQNPAVRRLTLVDAGLPDYGSDPDVVDPSYTECLVNVGAVGGAPLLLPTGHQGLVFRADGSITNGCPDDITLPAICLIAGGGGGGGGLGQTGGGGGAGGVAEGAHNALFRDVLIKAGETVPITVGSGGAAGAPGGDTVLWVHRVTGLALVPGPGTLADAYRAVGGGAGGDPAGSGGSGGGGNAAPPISGGGITPGGGGTAGQGRGGGRGADQGGLATCQQTAGGGGGSYAQPGQGAITPETGSEGGEGGAAKYLREWGVGAGSGGGGAAHDIPTGLGDLCPVVSQSGDPGGGGYGAGGGGGAGALGTAGGDGVAILAVKGGRFPVLAAPVISSHEAGAGNQVEVCIEAADWPAVTLPGYKVRVEYALTNSAPALFDDNAVRAQPYATGGYDPSTVSPLSLHTGFDFAQPATVHRDIGPKWEEMFGSIFDIDGGMYGSKFRSAPGGRIPKAGPDMADYLAAGGAAIPGIPAGFYGGLIRAVVDLPAEGYIIDVVVEGGGGIGSERLFVLFNFDAATGNGYGVEFMNEGYPKALYSFAAWVPTAVGLLLFPEAKLGALRIVTRPGQQVFIQGEQRAERSDATYPPSNGGAFIWVADGSWSQAPNTFYQMFAEYAFSKLQIFPESAEASGSLQPAADSGEWQLAGFLEAPGCLLGPEIPVGSKVWTRTVAEADNFKPSEPAEVDDETPETPQLIQYGVSVDEETGVATVTWDPDLFAGIVRIRGMIHDDTIDPADLAEPLPYIADRPSTDGSYVLPGVVAEGQEYTVDIEAWNAVAEPAGNAPLVKDDFNRANGEPGGTWDEVDTGAWGLNGNALNVAAFGLHYIRNTAVDREEMLVQGKVQSVFEGGSGLAARFRRVGVGDRNGYLLRADADFPGAYKLEKLVADVVTVLDTEADATLPGTTRTMQLYVRDGVQEAFANGLSMNAADATFDAVTGSAGFHYEMDSSATRMDFDDALVFPTKYATVTGLPAGWKAKVVNAAAAVVASAVAVAGTAQVDCSRFGGCTEFVPFDGWQALIVTDAADVEQARLQAVGVDVPVYPGVSVAYSVDLGITGGLAGEGQHYRTGAENPEHTSPSLDDVDDAVADVIAQLDSMILDDDLNLVLDDPLTLVLND